MILLFFLLIIYYYEGTVPGRSKKKHSYSTKKTCALIIINIDRSLMVFVFGISQNSIPIISQRVVLTVQYFRNRFRKNSCKTKQHQT